MNSKTLKSILILVLLVFFAGVLGAGYFYTVSQENKIRDKETEIDGLKKSELSLRSDIEKFQNREKEVVTLNRTLQDEAKLFGEQKKSILDQVRTSVSGFETFRASATDEIAKLNTSVNTLEAEKKTAEEKLASLETISSGDKERLTGQVEDLNKKIEELKINQIKLVQNLNNTDKVSMTSETAKLHYNLGNFYFKNSNYAAAAAEYKKALYYRPDDADANFNLAMVSDNFLEDYQTAIYRYRRYLELKPKASDRKKILERVMDLELRLLVMDEHPKKKDEPVFKAQEKAFSKTNLIGDKG